MSPHLFKHKNALLRIAPGLFAMMLLLLCATGSTAQTNTEVFGQNRVQYRKFDWRFFDTEHFRVYHYDAAGRSLARYVAEQAETDIGGIERRLQGRLPKRINIVLYNNYDEYRQTNVGRKEEGQLQTNNAGTVDIVGDKLVVYFTGIHTDLRRQLRAGMGTVLMERLLFGENFREIVKNAFLLNLPEWVATGFNGYLVDGWDAATESNWKALLEAHPKKNFYELGDSYPELAGRAFWKWVDDTRGSYVVKSLLINMQLKSSLNQGIKSTLGLPVRAAYDSVLAYYRTVFSADSLQQFTPDGSTALITIPAPKPGTTIRSIKASPRGADVAYIEARNGEWNVVIQKTEKEQRRSIIVAGGKLDFNETMADPDYPLMAWSNTGYKLAIIFRKGRQTRLRIYNSVKARIENYIIPPNRFDRVLSLAFDEDNDRIIFSAIKKSQTDLYSFQIRGSRMTPITNDAWDDIQPTYISGGSRRGILFLSNRPAPNMVVPQQVNELPTGPMNAFFYNTTTESPELLQCSFVKEGTVTQPIQYGPDNFAFLYDGNGIRNKYVVIFGRNTANMDSAFAVPVTNYSRNIINHQYNPASNSVANVVQLGDAYKVFFNKLEIPDWKAQPLNLRPTTLSTSGRSGSRSILLNSGSLQGTESPVKSGNTFQSEFPDEAPGTGSGNASRPDISSSDTDNILNPFIKDSTYLKLKAQPYRLSLKPDAFSVRVDNSVLFQKYQSVALQGGGFSNPSLGGMLTVALNDALEDHRFTGGIRLPINFSGSTYFFQYENFKRRWDWGLLYLRTENMYNYLVTYTDTAGRPIFQQDQIGKVTMNMLQGSANYAIDRRRRLGLHLGLRQDALNFKAQDTLSLTFSETQKDYWALSRAEYVFDNSRSPALNIRFGTRWKIYGEYLLKLNNGGGGMYNIGFDYRWYKQLYKNTIFATRIAGAHSAGKHNILWYVGGVDNWVSPKFGTNVPVSEDQEYAFTALATPLRGYPQNGRNGNTYALGNFEVRSPLLTTILRRPIQSNILRNLQLVAFADAGSAWDGLLPNTANMTKTVYLAQPPVYVKIDYTGASGLALGYGAGIRTLLAGYFMRLDAAWNIDDKKKKPMLYFSFGTDF